ncbi:MULTISPECIES: PaaX family transcriptional regulator [unclassified Rhodococcus (in: high G+C Gram-positive bacteria)]|uniref:PaaX family transcriptional regulator n=1 Tax=unclassified Rhodococcus (in: high G+C Gram-positive bacteria) TaxID=192944 RepID=UPI001C3D2FC5|nr:MULTISPECIES: PaaX family transcriptional regulator C-terminal domain-containing protein [unclassified Rhodococcus (in: high G+C Gram-positive bacteria)]
MTVSAVPGEREPSEVGIALRPQSLMLNFLGIHVLGRHTAVYSGSIIDVLGAVDVSEKAVRSTLTRMVDRNLLCKHRMGRKAYYQLTERATEVLIDGNRRIWETGAVNRDWDGTWTVVGFSLPDDRRSDRHDLRSRLSWAGFGLLQHAMWIAPGRKDVGTIVDSLGLERNVTVLAASAAGSTSSKDMAERAFDIEAIAGRYRDFSERWSRERSTGLELPSPMARQLVLHTDWLETVRQDPHLPAELLPEDWPAIDAEHLFKKLAGEYENASIEEASRVIDEVAPATPDPTVTDTR